MLTNIQRLGLADKSLNCVGGGDGVLAHDNTDFTSRYNNSNSTLHRGTWKGRSFRERFVILYQITGGGGVLYGS